MQVTKSIFRYFLKLLSDHPLHLKKLLYRSSLQIRMLCAPSNLREAAQQIHVFLRNFHMRKLQILSHPFCGRGFGKDADVLLKQKAEPYQSKFCTCSPTAFATCKSTSLKYRPGTSPGRHRLPFSKALCALLFASSGESR